MIKANDIEMVKLGGMTPEERERYEKNKIEINKKVSSLIAEATKNETRFVKGIFLIRERPAHNHDRALSK